MSDKTLFQNDFIQVSHITKMCWNDVIKTIYTNMIIIWTTINILSLLIMSVETAQFCRDGFMDAILSQIFGYLIAKYYEW